MMLTAALLSRPQVRFAHSVEASKIEEQHEEEQAPLQVWWKMISVDENEGSLQCRLRDTRIRDVASPQNKAIALCQRRIVARGMAY